jgi:hypothetical protein
LPPGSISTVSTTTAPAGFGAPGCDSTTVGLFGVTSATTGRSVDLGSSAAVTRCLGRGHRCRPAAFERSVRSYVPGGSLGGTMTNCPDLSATARSCTSPSRSSSTGCTRHGPAAMTASPVGSMLATSNVGTPSRLSGAAGDPISASTTAFASACAFASGPDSARAPPMRL